MTAEASPRVGMGMIGFPAPHPIGPSPNIEKMISERGTPPLRIRRFPNQGEAG